MTFFENVRGYSHWNDETNVYKFRRVALCAKCFVVQKLTNDEINKAILDGFFETKEKGKVCLICNRIS